MTNKEDYEKILDVFRNNIAEIDKEIIELLSRRIGSALVIGSIKKQLGLPVEDLSREQEVMLNIYLACQNSIYPIESWELAEPIWAGIMKFSKRLQQFIYDKDKV